MLGRLLRRIWYLLNRRRLERELEREMAAHRAEMGEPSRFGGTLRLREQSADVWGWARLDDLWHDLRYGLRQLRRTPGFALVAVLTLAVGIGANAAAFAVAKTLLFAELPVREPGALRQFDWGGRREFSPTTFQSVHEGASGFSALTCVTDRASVTIGRGDRYERAWAVWVSGGFFETFATTTPLGRPLIPADDRPGAPAVAIISHEWWQQRFGADPTLVGAAITVDDSPVTIVGVMPPGFLTLMGRRPPDLTLPISASARPKAADASTRERSCQIIGRLSRERAEELTRQESEMLLRRSGLSGRADGTLRSFGERPQLRLWPVGCGIDELRLEGDRLRNDLPQFAGGLFLLLAVLLVPCANVAAMLIARAMTRRPEIVARLALGASRMRVVRQLLTEGALLSVLAGAAGVLMAGIFVWSIGPPFALDPSVLAVTASLCALATLSFALAPALNATRGDLAARIRESSAGTPGRPRSAPGTVLVALQVLVSCVLLAVAGLQARALAASTTAFVTEPEHLLLFDADSVQPSADYVEDALGILNGLPGVASVAAASPYVRQATMCDANGEGARRQMRVWLLPISPGYLATMKIPVQRGRDIAWTDIRGERGVVVINDVLARSVFGRVDPVGQPLPLRQCQPDPTDGGDGAVIHSREDAVDRVLTLSTIVGVVADTFNGADVDFASGRGVAPTMYLPYPFAGGDGTSMTFAVRGARNATMLARPARLALQEAAPAVTIGAMHTQAERLRQQLGAMRTLTAVYLLLALLATAQSAFGLYGTVSHFVNWRTAEIGVRMVLGARTIDVVRLMLRQTLAPVLVGLLLGLACAPVVARVMRAARLVSDVGWPDMLAVAAGISVVMLAAFAAATSPVRRASRLDPAIALRED